MCDNLHLNSMKQCETPLNTLFFSRFNVNILQRGIRQDFKNKTGIAIDYQNEDDLYAIMRVVFINNAGDHETKNALKNSPHLSAVQHTQHVQQFLQTLKIAP